MAPPPEDPFGRPPLVAVPDEYSPAPNDPGAERAVLGAMMAHPAIVPECSDIMLGSSFYTDMHVQAWYAIKTLHASGLPTEPVAVIHEMQRGRAGVDPKLGLFLAECYSTAPLPSSVTYYIEIIQTLARQRKLAETGIRFTQLAARPRMDREELDRAYTDALGFLQDVAPTPTVPDQTLHPIPLTEFLATPDSPITYRLDQLWPAGGRVILAAQYKAGKSTLIANLIRSLADGHPFLGKFTPNPTLGRVTLIDDELDVNMLRRWLREQQIENTDHVNIRPLRGRLSTFNILDPATRTAWALRLQETLTEILIFDCLRPVLDSLGLDENHDAGRFLVAFDELLAEAGITEAVVVHHAGHQGDRSRGDSRLRDWPDVEWRILREAEDTEDDTGRRPRTYFSALGRDVDEPEGLLTYEPTTRWLTLAGGTRKQTESDTAIPQILAYLTANPGLSQRQIEAANPGNNSRDRLRAALKRGIDLGKIDTSDGSRGARLHFAASDWSDK